MSGGGYKEFKLNEKSLKFWNLLVEAKEKNSIFDCYFMVIDYIYMI
jgi:hypothetical protein